MIFQKILQGATLATGFADEHVTARQKPGKLFWVCGFNHTAFVVELLAEGGPIIGICQPFAPFKHHMNVRYEELLIHKASGAMVPAAPLANADLAFYIGFTDVEPDLIPTPW